MFNWALNAPLNCILYYHAWQSAFPLVMVTGGIFLNLHPHHTRPWVEGHIFFRDKEKRYDDKCFMNDCYADFGASQ